MVLLTLVVVHVSMKCVHTSPTSHLSEVVAQGAIGDSDSKGTSDIVPDEDLPPEDLHHLRNDGKRVLGTIQKVSLMSNVHIVITYSSPLRIISTSQRTNP